MINLISGHLGNGDWRFKKIDGITVLAFVQAFNRHDEYRLGPDQVLGYEIEQTLENNLKVKILLSDERHCLAYIPNDELQYLDDMVRSTKSAPTYKRQNDRWINGLLIFFAACLVYEFLK